jgi:hypothetical protein
MGKKPTKLGNGMWGEGIQRMRKCGMTASYNIQKILVVSLYTIKA